MCVYRKEHLTQQGDDSGDFRHMVSEYTLVRQILFMFYTMSSTQLFEVANNRIVVKPGITISSLTKVCHSGQQQNCSEARDHNLQFDKGMSQWPTTEL